MTRFLVIIFLSLLTTFISSAKDIDQLRAEFRDMGFGMFIHFNMGTFHEKEWVEPGQDPLTFNPQKLDCHQWTKAAKSAGMKYAVLTTKHHDGFCLWDTKVSEYDVAASAISGRDIVREFVDACHKDRITPCIYFSIWDRTLGIEGTITQEDIEIIKTQLTELLTNYGDFALIIFDGWGNCGTEWKQEDCEGIYSTVRALQPNILIMDHYQLRRGLSYDEVYKVEDILHFEEPVGEWVPEGNKFVAQQSPTLQSAWFWKTYFPTEELRSVDDIVNRHIRLLDTRNCNFLLNCAPNRNGLMDDNVVQRLKEIGEELKANPKRTAQMTVTTNDKPWQISVPIRQTVDKEQNTITLTIHPELKEQQMMGFGGCFNEMSWDALNMLSQPERDKIMHELFSSDGANFNYNRFPIGASDYANDWYSFNEADGDFEMANFSIDHDKDCIIPYIKSAQSFNPEMRFFASPWCPPSWMKTNRNYASLSSKQYNNLDEAYQSLPNTTGFVMLRGYLEAYALYLSKAIEAYMNEGIDINDLHVQNEVWAEQVFPSCIWKPDDIALFIGDYLGPEFDKKGIDTNIWLGTLNVDDPNYMRTVLSNENASKYIKGMGFQWIGKNAISTMHKEYPNMSLIQTENECGNGENNWAAAMHTWDLMKIYLNGGAQAYTYWNFILPTPGTSHWGWTQNSMVTINKDTKEVRYTPEYYLMKHLSHYIKPNAYKVKIDGYDDALAFTNPDGSCIVVIVNPQSQTQEISLILNSSNYKISLKPNSINTIKI